MTRVFSNLHHQLAGTFHEARTHLLLQSGAASVASAGSCYSSKAGATSFRGAKPPGGALERRPTAEIRVEVPRLREAVAPPFALPPRKDSLIPSPGQAPPHNP